MIDIRGVLILCERVAQFRARIAIQRADFDIEVVTATVIPAVAGSGTGIGYIQAVGKQFFQFDPNANGNGAIGGGAFWRLGVVYSEAALGAIGRGDVLMRAGYRLG